MQFAKSKNMKTLRLSFLLFSTAVLLLLNTQCKKSHSSPPLTELQKLPALTQNGRNTFGCLINGKAFMPGGGGIFTNVLSARYDPTQGGIFSITAKYYFADNSRQFINLGAFGVNAPGTYNLQLHSPYAISYVLSNNSGSCDFNTWYDTPISGTLVITRFDTNPGIVSGTFSFKATTAACGTIEGTDGRFDVSCR